MIRAPLRYIKNGSQTAGSAVFICDTTHERKRRLAKGRLLKVMSEKQRAVRDLTIHPASQKKTPRVFDRVSQPTRGLTVREVPESY